LSLVAVLVVAGLEGAAVLAGILLLQVLQFRLGQQLRLLLVVVDRLHNHLLAGQIQYLVQLHLLVAARVVQQKLLHAPLA